MTDTDTKDTEDITLTHHATGKEYRFPSIQEMFRILKEIKPTDFIMNLDKLIESLEHKHENIIQCQSCGAIWHPIGETK